MEMFVFSIAQIIEVIFMSTRHHFDIDTSGFVFKNSEGYLGDVIRHATRTKYLPIHSAKFFVT